MPFYLKGIKTEFNGEKAYHIVTPSKPFITLKYPPTCDELTYYPYKLSLERGIYKFECWGAAGKVAYSGTAGLGAYTGGIITIEDEMTFFIYIGTTGFFNAVKTPVYLGPHGGGATDVRLVNGTEWHDIESLASRIMVAAGGGSAEREPSIGGNGGDIEGGTSTYGSNFSCNGATQISSVDCGIIYIKNKPYQSVAGSFG